MPNNIQQFAFTSKGNGILRKLESFVAVNNNGNGQIVPALWDTGATSTCISKKLAADLKLTATGYTKVNTPSGSNTYQTYLVDIVLPNNVTIKDVKVCESEIGDQGLGALLGMDIISLGEFCVSSCNGCTWFSFRTPAKKHTDYAEEINIQNITGVHGKGKRKRK